MILKIKGATNGVAFYKAKVSLVALMLIFCTTFTAFATSNLITTTVIYDDEETTVVSFVQEPEEIIEKSGFEISESDVINLDSFDITDEQSVIEIEKAYSVTIEVDEEIVAMVMVAGNVLDALELAEIELYDGDELSLSRYAQIEQDTTISIMRAFGVTLVCDGHSYSFDVSDCTVQDLLDMSGVTLGSSDTISHDLDEVLSEETVVTVKRVTYEQYEEIQETAFDTIYEDSADLNEGESSIYQAGVNGETVMTYEATYIDDALYETQLLSSVTTQEVVDEIILVGTKVVVTTTAATTQAAVTQAAATTAAATTTTTTTTPSISSSSNVISELTPPSSLVLDSDGIPTSYVDVITGPATAYCSGTTTATGETVIPGRVAVDPDEIPYGSTLYIVSSDGSYVYGYSVASDTGGFTSSNTVVDLYMNTYSECISFGRRNVTIYVLSYG